MGLKRSSMPARTSWMSRGGRLNRGKALKPGKPLQRWTELRNTSSPGPSWSTVEAVLERDGWACIRCGLDVYGDRGEDWSLQHRLPRGQGGSSNPDNLAILCGSGTTGCHGWVESYRAASYACGWLVERDKDPARVAVAIAGRGRTWLTVDGRYADTPPEAEAA